MPGSGSTRRPCLRVLPLGLTAMGCVLLFFYADALPAAHADRGAVRTTKRLRAATTPERTAALTGGSGDADLRGFSARPCFLRSSTGHGTCLAGRALRLLRRLRLRGSGLFVVLGKDLRQVFAPEDYYHD